MRTGDLRTGDRGHSTQILGLTYRQHIGGRWAISLIAYVINAPLNLLAILGNFSSAPEPHEYLPWAVVAVSGYLSLGAVVLVANYTIFRHRFSHPVPVWWVVALGAVAGGTRGFVVAALAESMGLTNGDVPLIATRVGAGMLLGAIGMPMLALTLSSITQYVSQRQKLVAAKQRLQTERMQAEGISEALRVALVESVQVDLNEVARTQDAELARAVSHRVWESGEDVRRPRVRWGRVFVTAFIHNPYSTVAVSFLWLVSAWGGLIPAIGVFRGLAQMVFGLACIAVCFAAGRWLAARSIHSLLIFLLVMLVLVVLTGPVAAVIFDARDFSDSASLVIISVVWLPLMTVVAGIVINAVRSSEEVLSKLTRQVGKEEIAAAATEQENMRIRRELATTLHGNVQSRLLAAAGLMRQPALLQQAGVSDPSSLLHELTIDLDTKNEVDERDLAEQIDAVTQPWSGLMAISVNVTGEVPQRCATAIVRVVEETVTNSFRHGNATTVMISISGEVKEIVVIISDNGSGPDPRSAQGLGSTILDSCGAWEMTAIASGGTAVRVSVPITHA